MPAKDTFHDVVKNALIKDGWTITHDPYTLSFGSTRVYADLGAERPIAAERAGQKIAVEIKSFLGDSNVRDLEQALGQFVLYRLLMRNVEPDRLLLLAVPESAYKSILEGSTGRDLIGELQLKIAIFNPDREEILQWLL